MPTKVILHIYDVSTSGEVRAVNQYLTAMGTGAFHGGIEVYGQEWSYGGTPNGTGVFACPPKGCTMHHYRESVEVGTTSMSEEAVNELLEKMKLEWPGAEYDLLRRNCVIFSNTFSKALGAGPIPAWCTNLAAAGATLQDGVITATTEAQKMAIIAKAKAGEFDAKYNIQGNAQVAAQEVIAAWKDANEKYRIQENTAAASAKAVELGQDAAKKALELEREYKLREKGQAFASDAAKQVADFNAKYDVAGKAANFTAQAQAGFGRLAGEAQQIADQRQQAQAAGAGSATQASGDKVMERQTKEQDACKCC